MTGVFTGFAVVVFAIVVGYVLGRMDVLGPHARHVLSRLVFFALSPFLLFTLLSSADVHTLFSTLLPVSAAAALAVIAVFAVVSRLVWRRDVGSTVIGSLAAGYVNAGNIGIPIAGYVLGDGALAAPVTLVQLLVFMPVSFVILDAQRSDGVSILRILGQTVRNPMLIGSALGVLVSVTGVRLPEVVTEPIHLVAAACVPIMLISYGISLHGQRVLTTVGRRRDVLLASGLKLLVMPATAWALAEFVFHLSPAGVFAVTVLATLPTAQNVFNYAQRYDTGEIVARDTIFVTTLLSLPALVVVALLLTRR